MINPTSMKNTEYRPRININGISEPNNNKLINSYYLFQQHSRLIKNEDHKSWIVYMHTTTKPVETHPGADPRVKLEFCLLKSYQQIKIISFQSNTLAQIETRILSEFNEKEKEKMIFVFNSLGYGS